MRLYYQACQSLCRWWYILFMRGRAFHVERVPRCGGVLLACNHQSFFDPVLAALPLPRECDFMARDTLFANRAFRGLIVSLNAFPIRRGEADVGAIKETLRRLKGGRLVIAFPEGTRSEGGQVLPMLPGVASIARKARVPIVPVLIEGAFEAWPRHRKFPGRATVTVAYGEPVDPETIQSRPPECVMDQIRRRIIEMQNTERCRRGRMPLQYERA
jgi:1-acyl-sn-glycerol-3-phosphate acyltransferase